jgi:hypothetical protein
LPLSSSTQFKFPKLNTSSSISEPKIYKDVLHSFKDYKRHEPIESEKWVSKLTPPANMANSATLDKVSTVQNTQFDLKSEIQASLKQQGPMWAKLVASFKAPAQPAPTAAPSFSNSAPAVTTVPAVISPSNATPSRSAQMPLLALDSPMDFVSMAKDLSAASLDSTMGNLLSMFPELHHEVMITHGMLYFSIIKSHNDPCLW